MSSRPIFPPHLRQTREARRPWVTRVLQGLIIAAAVAAALFGTGLLGCAARTPFAEPGPITVSETTTSTSSGTTYSSTKSRAAAELEYRLKQLDVAITRARILARYGGYGYGGGSVNTTGEGYRPYRPSHW